jgi:hypothetical protein
MTTANWVKTMPSVSQAMARPQTSLKPSIRRVIRSIVAVAGDFMAENRDKDLE